MNVKIEINVKSINTPTGIKGAEICKSIHCEVLAICENKVYKMHSKSWKNPDEIRNDDEFIAQLAGLPFLENQYRLLGFDYSAEKENYEIREDCDRG